MRALLSALLVGVLVSNAAAQPILGPVPINNTVNGVPITLSTTSRITFSSVNNGIRIKARIFADLIDLQRKLPNVMSTFALPTDGCAKRHRGNQGAAVVLQSGSLWPVDDQLVLSMRGYIDVWSCISGPKKSTIRWRNTKIAFIHLKVPIIHVWRNISKRKDGAQPFHGTVPIYLVKKKDKKLALHAAKPDVTMDGKNILVTKAILHAAEVDIDKQAHSALQQAISPEALKKALPTALQKLNMTVVAARFSGLGGHAIAEIDLSANVSQQFAEDSLN